MKCLAHTAIALIFCLLLSNCTEQEVTDNTTDAAPAFLIPQQRFYRTGQLLAKFSITPDSLMHGLYEEYDTNGQVHRRMQYSNGSLNGEYESFYASGQLASRHVFVDGHPHGPYRWYFENGQLMQQGEKVWGRAEGQVEIYSMDGHLQSRQHYVNDQLKGAAAEYFPNGRISSFGAFDRYGARIFTIHYLENGHIDEVSGTPFLDLQAALNRFSGKFSLGFDLALPPDMLPEVRLLRRQDNKAWWCTLNADSLHYSFEETLPDDYQGKYQLLATYLYAGDTLRFQEEIFVQRNNVTFGAPL